MSVQQIDRDAAFRAHAEILRRDISAMREKQVRLAAAILDRSQKLNRIEAVAILGARLPSRRPNE